MAKNMLIDAAHAEETRVVVLSGNNLEEFDVETKEKQQIRGNIYLAKVTRVEPSLQAGFIDFGSERHGFLAFSEVHPDYYQIPIEDREALIAEEAALTNEDSVDDDEESSRARRALNRRYKIQDVLRRRQIMLVQAVKEERGNKGAALTTYLSLAGRYCVLMPNTPRGGGISRKIIAASDRSRLKSIVSELHVPKGMGLIIRTAGAKRNKTEIKRDYEYLLRLWDDIRSRTLESVAPCLIHEEDSLVKRAIRDLYTKEVGSIVIEGDAAYKEAKDFVKMLIPSHARRVHQYKHSVPLFTRMGVDGLLGGIHSGIVNLKSGGYIVINQTEALVAIDVNSGKSTRERSIEQTALKTNLEAAEEVARQMRLRDLAGLVVIDFIDMDEPRNDRAVEKKMKDALRLDRARVQMGKISNFGLMEISRQRRRTGVLEGSSHVCPSCSGFGRVRAPSSAATQIIREIESAVGGRSGCEIEVKTDTSTALYLLNEKRIHLVNLQSVRGIAIKVVAVSDIHKGSYEFEIINHGEEVEEAEFNMALLAEAETDSDVNDHDNDDFGDEDSNSSDLSDEKSEEIVSRSKRRRSRRRGRSNNNSEELNNNTDSAPSEESANEASDEANAENEQRDSNKKRRRGRRGGRNRRDNQSAASNGNLSNELSADTDQENESESNASPKAEEDAPAAKAPRKRKTNSKAVAGTNTDASTEVNAAIDTDVVNPKPKRTRKSKVAAVEAVEASTEEAPKANEKTPKAPKPKAKKAGDSSNASSPEVAKPVENDAKADEQNVGEPKAPRKTGWWARNADKLFKSANSGD